jgi:hypothetical protein
LLALDELRLVVQNRVFRLLLERVVTFLDLGVGLDQDVFLLIDLLAEFFVAFDFADDTGSDVEVGLVVVSQPFQTVHLVVRTVSENAQEVPDEHFEFFDELKFVFFPVSLQSACLVDGGELCSIVG